MTWWQWLVGLWGGSLAIAVVLNVVVGLVRRAMSRLGVARELPKLVLPEAATPQLIILPDVAVTAEPRQALAVEGIGSVSVMAEGARPGAA